ncbi:major centromere autoantigen B-like [Uloborus diversus]|uniref:major centromere autoantigen B-like n=1 Tax=Uloborus diversus TaxID=327109 RepID=UPI0024094AE4|nr:major centromere autoantigen B-like [Uloborus diversus]
MSFKRNYRKLLLRRIVSALDEGEEYKVDVLAALHLSKAAWNGVSEKTITNCFHHAGFKKPEEIKSTAEMVVQAIENENFDEEEEMLQEISNKMQLDETLNLKDYAKIDDDLECVEHLTEDELISRYCRQEEIAVSSSDEEENEIFKI